MICHGGSGTTLGALAQGLPLVLVPQGADQFDNAARCVASGVAVVIGPGELSADAVRRALRQVLDDPSFAAAARASRPRSRRWGRRRTWPRRSRSTSGSRSPDGRWPVSARARVTLIVAALALVAALAVTGVAVLSAQEVESPAGTTAPAKPQKGFPPLALSLGAREDEQAQQLRRAADLYEAGRQGSGRRSRRRSDFRALRLARGQARRRRSRPGRRAPTGSSSSGRSSRAARSSSCTSGSRASGPAPAAPSPPGVRRATSSPTRRTRCARATCCTGSSRPACRSSSRASPSGSRAARSPRSWSDCRTTGRCAAASSTASRCSGSAGPCRPAARTRRRCASRPTTSDALVADAVGRYSKEHPEAAFSRLGPLTRRFPRSAGVRFHLGVLLLWQGDVREAKRQLRLAQAAAPRSPIATEAQRYLTELAKVGTG